jgi:hypothetical protein
MLLLLAAANNASIDDDQAQGLILDDDEDGSAAAQNIAYINRDAIRSVSRSSTFLADPGLVMYFEELGSLNREEFRKPNGRPPVGGLRFIPV